MGNVTAMRDLAISQLPSTITDRATGQSYSAPAPAPSPSDTMKSAENNPVKATSKKPMGGVKGPVQTLGTTKKTLLGE